MSRRNLLVTLSLVSGLGGIVYEVLYLRHLTTVLGDMFYVHAALLGMFLFGNGLGAWVAHRLVRWLFACELVIGLYALALPVLVNVYEASALSHAFGSPVSQTLFASALLLAVPSIALGISIPLFSAYIRAEGESRDAFKLAYLLYNLGAAISVALVEFFVVRWFGLSLSLYVVATANLACAALLLAGRGRWKALRGAGEEPGESAGVEAKAAAALLLASVAASLFMAYYIKVCYHLFLPHRQNFAICTAVSLLALAVGVGLVRRLRLSFGAMVALAMASLVVVYAAFDAIVGSFALLDELAPPWTVTLREFLYAFVLAIPYVFLGGTIPALLRSEENVARRSGFLLLVSGIGNVAGMLIYIFWVHPSFRLFLTPTLAWALLLAALVTYGWPAARRWIPVAALVSVLGLPWIYLKPDSRVYLIHDDTPAEAEITHYKAASDNVSFISNSDRTYISYNGHPSIFVTQGGRVNRAEIVSGVIPALVVRDPDRALVLGLGSGITGGATARMFRHTDVVEINSAFFPLLPRISRANFDILENPAATIIHDDARSYLATTSERYDVVVNSIPSPTYFAAGKIYTREFFAMVRRALRPGGVYCSWFAPLDMSREGLRTFLATLDDAFDYCNLAVLRNGYYFTSCSDEPIELRDPEDVEFAPRVEEALQGLVGVTLEQYFGAIFVSENILESLELGEVQLNTDDFPIMEFQIMRRDRSSRRPEQLPDPLVFEPERYNVDLGLEGPGVVDRAIVFAQLHPPLFLQAYRPILERSPQLAAEFNERLGARPAPGQ
jgi:spermidine synthase